MTYSLEKIKLLSQLDKNASFYEDRRNEFTQFWGITKEYLEELGTIVPFNSDEFKKVLHSFFPSELTKFNWGLFKCYEWASELYAVRHMLGRLNKIEMMYPILDFIQKHISIENTRIYDYGCGIGDICIALNVLGYETYACDLKNKLLEFTKFRFETRKMKTHIEELTCNNVCPKMNNSYFDMIICREVLEHIRDPYSILTIIHKALKKNGYFFTSSLFPKSYRIVGGTHLKEAIRQSKTRRYLNFFHDNFCEDDKIKGLYKKK
ncbi:methyltransferase domain-containing protein [bacterium]|nr:methyltransferase domain-containing protein [bacterium]